MPSALVKSYAKETGKSVAHVERWWDEAKEQALKKFPDKGPSYWAYVNGIVEKRGKLVHGKKKKRKVKEGMEKMTFKQFIAETDVPRHEGFCPGCGQPSFNGVILHTPQCPYYEQPDYDDE